MNDGKIEILGQKQVMLPLAMMASLQNDQTFDVANKEIQKSMEYYAKKMGGSSGGMLKSVLDIYETTGLGKMQIIKLDVASKEAILRIIDGQFDRTDLLEGVLCGQFSYFFNKQLLRQNIKVTKKTTYLDIFIK